MDTWFSAIDGLAAFQKTEDPFTAALKREVRIGLFRFRVYFKLSLISARKFREGLYLKFRSENGR